MNQCLQVHFILSSDKFTKLSDVGLGGWMPPEIVGNGFLIIKGMTIPWVISDKAQTMPFL